MKRQKRYKHLTLVPFAMSEWKATKIGKKPSRTGSQGWARLREKVPPPGGWPGGEPEKNGYRPGAK